MRLAEKGRCHSLQQRRSAWRNSARVLQNDGQGQQGRAVLITQFALLGRKSAAARCIGIVSAQSAPTSQPL